MRYNTFNMKNVAVIIVTYNFPRKRLQNLVESICKQGIAKSSVYISDNTTNNRGYGGGINAIVRKIINKYKYFLILNPDIKLHHYLLARLLDTINLSKNYGIVGPKIISENGKLWSIGGSIDRVRYSGGFNLNIMEARQEIPVDFISGTVMLIKKEVFEEIGYFNEDYFLYYEDVDFCQRAKQKGFSLIVNPNAVITHSASTSVGKNSPAMLYYMSRNHLLFQEKYAPVWVKIREILRLPKTLFEARNRKDELLGILDYFFRKFGKNKKILSKADIL